MACEDTQLAAVLNDARCIAIVGLSGRSESSSYGVAVHLKCNGYPVITVNPMFKEIFGTRSYQSVSEIPGGVDLVVVFRRPMDVPDVVRDVIEASPQYPWLQVGLRNDEAAAIAENRGIAVYQDICIKQTHQRLAKASVLKQ